MFGLLEIHELIEWQEWKCPRAELTHWFSGVEIFAGLGTHSPFLVTICVPNRTPMNCPDKLAPVFKETEQHKHYPPWEHPWLSVSFSRDSEGTFLHCHRVVIKNTYGSKKLLVRSTCDEEAHFPFTNGLSAACDLASQWRDGDTDVKAPFWVGRGDRCLFLWGAA